MAQAQTVDIRAASGSSAKKRMTSFDAIRGFSVISMVLFHLCYDLRFVYAYDLPWFKPPLQDIWRASISWVFLFVAGCMCTFSRNAIKRSTKYLLAAFAVFVVTYVAAIDVPISFGIIFCMGASTLIEYLLGRCHLVLKGTRTAATLFMLFLLLRGIPRGYVGIGQLRLTLPHQLYATPWFSFLGFPGPGFASGDYYPILPFTLMFLCGTAMARHWHEKGFPRMLQTLTCRPLEWVGQHALPIYLAHQPLIVGILEALELLR